MLHVSLQVVRQPRMVPDDSDILPAVDPLSRLAEQARAGDDRALGALVEAAYEPTWRLCATLVDAHSADDLAQEAILRVVGSLQGYRGDSTARAWILAIARHTCIDHLRTRARHQRRAATLLASTPQGSPQPDASEQTVVADLLHRLEPDRRSAFALTQVIGLTYREAAQVCECPTGTIRSRVARARSDLLAMLELAMLESTETAKPGAEHRSGRSDTA